MSPTTNTSSTAEGGGGEERHRPLADVEAANDLNTLLCVLCLLLCGMLAYLVAFPLYSSSSSSSSPSSTNTFHSILLPPHPIDCPSAAAAMKIDVVYTWVNGSDEEFIRSMQEHQNQSFSPNRFHDRDELRYSLRSLEKFAPWINRVFLVTNGQVPHWLNTSRVTIVTHDEIFPDKSHLPTFSSPAIEANLFRIPNLSAKFLYFNDDVFLAAPVTLENFLTSAHGRQKVYLSWEVPDCASGCAEHMLGDLYCDAACDVPACDFDGGDCVKRGGGGAAVVSRRGEDDVEENEPDDDDDDKAYGGGGASLRGNGHGDSLELCGSEGCLLKWIGDGVCDAACRVLACGFDGGDCHRDTAGVLMEYSSLDRIPVPANGETTAFLVKFDGEALSPQSAQGEPYSGIIRWVVAVERWDAVVVVAKYPPVSSSPSNTSSFQVLHQTWSTITLQFLPVTVPSSTGDEEEEEGEEDGSDGGASFYAQSLAYTRRRLKQHFAATLPGYKTNAETANDDDDDNDNDDGEGSTSQVNNKVPAHMPHLIDKYVLERLVMAALPAEFAATSAHRFRHEHDMQFSYAYFTYLMTMTTMAGEEEDNTGGEFAWQLVDTHRDGCLNGNEFRTLLAMILREEPNFVHSKDQDDALLESLKDEDDNDDDTSWLTNKLPEITPDLLKRAQDEIWKQAPPATTDSHSCMSLEVVRASGVAFAALQRNARATALRTRAAFEIVPNIRPYVTFARLDDDPGRVLRMLDQLRSKPTQFVCINDDTSHRQSQGKAERVAQALQAYFESQFPDPSSYEWQPGGARLMDDDERRLRRPPNLAATPASARVLPVWALLVIVGGFVLLAGYYCCGASGARLRGLLLRVLGLLSPRLRQLPGKRSM